MRKRGLLLLVVLVVISGVAAGGYFVGHGFRTDKQAAADASPAARATLTEKVQKRQLTEQVVFRATVSMSLSVDVTQNPAPTGFSPIVTATPIRRAGVVKAGDAVLGVAGRPIVVLRGVVPAYRDLALGDAGPDVAQLQAALADAGHDPGTRNGQFGQSTASAVTAVWRSAGYPPPSSSPASPLASSGSGSVPRAEVLFIPQLPALLSTISVGVGSLLTDKASMTLSSGDRFLAGVVPMGDGVNVRVGQAVNYVDDATGNRGKGSIVTLGDAVSSQDGSGLVRPVTVSLDAAFKAPTGANIRATIDDASTAGPVLVVPILAVVSGTDGGQHVTIVDGGKQREVPVQTGLSSDGLVEVRPQEGAALSEGDECLVSQ